MVATGSAAPILRLGGIDGLYKSCYPLVFLFFIRHPRQHLPNHLILIHTHSASIQSFHCIICIMHFPALLTLALAHYVAAGPMPQAPQSVNNQGLHALAKARGKYFGTAVSANAQFDKPYRDQLSNPNEFGMLVAENAMKVCKNTLNVKKPYSTMISGINCSRIGMISAGRWRTTWLTWPPRTARSCAATLLSSTRPIRIGVCQSYHLLGGFSGEHTNSRRSLQ